MIFLSSKVMALLVYGAGPIWRLRGLARLQGTWEQSQSRTATLRFALQNTGRQFMGQVQEMKRLDGEIVAAKKNLELAKSDQQHRRNALVNEPPPAPEEIYLTAEFPPSR